MKMKPLRITTAALAAIRTRALKSSTPVFPISSPEHFHGDGTVSIEADQETIDALAAAAAPGESISETIIRLCATAGRPLN